MKFANAILFLVLVAAQVALPRFAQSMDKHEQTCSDSALAAVGAFLRLSTFKVPPRGDSAGPDAIIVSAACKPDPSQKNHTIIAVAYGSGKEDVKRFVVALVDEQARKVLASLKDEIAEDAAMVVEPRSLRIDTAPYRLTEGVRAFGVDLRSGYIPHCGDGGIGAQRTLYVRDGKKLRPVFSITMSYWRFVEGGNPRCMAIDKEPPKTIVEGIGLTIGFGPGKTNGYRDIVVTATSWRDDGQPTGKGVFRYTLHYDGRWYHADEMIDELYKWNK